MIHSNPTSKKKQTWAKVTQSFFALAFAASLSSSSALQSAELSSNSVKSNETSDANKMKKQTNAEVARHTGIKSKSEFAAKSRADIVTNISSETGVGAKASGTGKAGTAKSSAVKNSSSKFKSAKAANTKATNTKATNAKATNTKATKNKSTQAKNKLQATKGAAQTVPIQVELLISEPCSLMTFMDSISERHHTTTWVKKWYAKIRGQKLADDKEFINEYQNLMNATANKSYKDETGRDQDLDQYVICLASQCKSVHEFTEILKQKLEKEQFEKLKIVIEHFAPLYHELLWQPRLPEFQKQLAAAQDSLTSTKISQRLQQVQHFMGAKWPAGVKCTVVLIPLPKFGFGRISTSGENLGRVQTVEVLPGKKTKIDLDVIFHEACHALWHTSPTQHLIAQECAKQVNGSEAYNELNEGMATALGQGWFSQQAYGKVQKNWYVDEVTDKYARALYPLICEYMDNGKQIDSEFAKRASEIFGQKFAKAISSRQFMTTFEVYCDKLDNSTALSKSVQTALPRLHSFSISCPLDNPQSLSAFQSSTAKQMAIMLPAEKLNSMLEWGFSAEQIERLKTANGPMILQSGGRKILFCIAPIPEKQIEMLFNALQKQNWSPSK